jgi:D-aminopeptidase
VLSVCRSSSPTYTGHMKLASAGWTVLGFLGGLSGVEAPLAAQGDVGEAPRPRARDLGIVIGSLPVGPRNAITDVAGVRVGHATVIRDKNVRTGVTVVLPHGGNLYRDKVPAAIYVGNGYGKLVGITQVEELGELESPVVLTNTLNVGKMMDAMVAHMLAIPGNERVRSINVVVGETNDGGLNDIRGRHVSAGHLQSALAGASATDVREGCVGAGTGTICFGWKGGIGTASRRVDKTMVGVLVQTNFGGSLTIKGVPIPGRMNPSAGGKAPRKAKDDGSCMIVVATDAPLRARNLNRLAQRALAGMARTGASFSNGSGDYVIAFSTAAAVRVNNPRPGQEVPNAKMTALFKAVAEASEEAIVNSLCRATSMTGSGRTVPAIPIARLKAIFAK